MHRLQPLLEAVLGKQLALPERKLTSIEQFVARFSGVKRVMIGDWHSGHCRKYNFNPYSYYAISVDGAAPV